MMEAMPMGTGIVPTMDINGNDGFGNGGFGAWFLIILIVLFGWGRGGYGYGSDGSGANMNYVLSSDFATLQRQLSDGFSTVEKNVDTVRNGLCDGFYTNAQLINGTNTNILQSTNTLQGAIKDCCCQTQSAIANVNFNNAQNTCAITNAMTLNTRDIIDNQNANYRALHDEIVANRIEDKNAQIQAMQNEINSLRLASSQCSQNAYLIDQLNPSPRPAYIVPQNTCGCYNPCGCGNI